VYTLLDAAALATTAPLDFSDESGAPDFTCVSFYKIFGFPDLGALIVRKAAGHILQSRRAFFGGTVEMVITFNRSWHAKKEQTLHDRLEDGTLPFHSIIALGAALDVHKRLFGSMQQISAHTAFLTKRLFEGLNALKHYNDTPVCRIYNEASAVYGDSKTQGATVALNIFHADGEPAGYADVEKLANEHNIHVRSGTLCNPGGFANYLSWSPTDMLAAYRMGHRCNNPIQSVDRKPTGVVRVSLGAMSNMEDVDTFLRFIRRTYVEAAAEPWTSTAVQQTAVQQTTIKVDSMDNLGPPVEGGIVENVHSTTKQNEKKAEDKKLSQKVLTALMVWKGKSYRVQQVSV
jgi:molybdenum cofactor sulfurtransferase